MIDRHPTVTVLTARGEGLPPGLDALRKRAAVRHADDTDSLRHALPGSEILLVTDFRTTALQAAWGVADTLRWIHLTSAGVDAVDCDAVRASSVVVSNARGIFDGAIAEYVLGVILAFAKDTRTNVELAQRRQWRHRDTERIAGRQVLVVGAGSVGHAIGRLCAAAGMRTLGVARRARPGNKAFEAIHAIDTLDAHLPGADYVVIALPLTGGTRHLFDAPRLGLMAARARLINVGRGAVVDTAALVDALCAGRIAGAALDVFEREPLPADDPLWAAPNALLSAHMAGDFIGWREALSEQFVQHLSCWLAGEALPNRVDLGRSDHARGEGA